MKRQIMNLASFFKPFFYPLFRRCSFPKYVGQIQLLWS